MFVCLENLMWDLEQQFVVKNILVGQIDLKLYDNWVLALVLGGVAIWVQKLFMLLESPLGASFSPLNHENVDLN